MGFPRTKTELRGWVEGLRETCETQVAHAVVDCIEDVARRILAVPLTRPAEAANLHGKLRQHFRELDQAKNATHRETMADLRNRARAQDSRAKRMGMH